MKNLSLLMLMLIFMSLGSAQTGIEPFDPATPATYLGDFEGFAVMEIIPEVSLYEEEGNLGDNLLADDGSGSGATLTPGMGMFCAMLQSADSSIILVSPEMDFGIYTGSPTLEFRYFIDDGTSAGAPGWFELSQIEVVFKESAGDAWTSIATFTTVDNTWHDEIVDLSGASSYSTYYLGFRVSTPLTATLLAVGIMGFDEIVVTGNTCADSFSAFTDDACLSYTVPSGTYQVFTSGTYNDTIPNASGCDSILTIDVNITTPDVGISLIGSTLHADATGVTYQWFSCPSGTPVAGATSQDFVPAVDGDFGVIINDGGCIDSSGCITYTGAGIFDIPKSNVNIYPNPANDYVTIECAEHVQLQKISILGFDGRLVKSIQPENARPIYVSLENLPSGHYIIQISGSAGSIHQLLLIQ